ncbi:unnamed protein product, partial [Closterium sp. NIES-54]
SGVAIFNLDYDAILSAMYDLSTSAEGDYYRCVPPDPGIAAAALGASESGTLPGTAPAEALHTFTLDSGASRCFFRDSTTLTPLSAPVPVRLADPSGGPVVARSFTVLPCPAVLFRSLSGLHLPSFSTNLVSSAALQDAMVTTTTPGGQRVSICTCTRAGRHLATFTRRPGSSLYTLATEHPLVVAPAQVSASGQVAASCSCRLLSHQTLLWHHRLGHPSLPRLRGMHSRLLVSGLPRSLPTLPPSPAPLCLPCVEGRQRAAPHSSFPPTISPLQTLHMDVWGPACITGQGRERFYLLVVDDYTRYTTVFPLRSKGQVVDVLIPWIRTVRLQLRERFSRSAPPLAPLATAPDTAATATAATTAAAAAATAAPEYYATMASLRVLAFDHEGRPVAFDTWHDDLQLYLLSDIKESVSLIDHVSGVAPAPPTTSNDSTRFRWLSRDTTARLAIRNHLPLAECTHFGQHRPSDLVTHLRTSDARYRATVPTEFLATNQPPMFITLYFIVSRLPDSLRSVRDHFLSLDPTSLTVDLLEQHLLAAETSAVAVGAARGTPCPPFLEGAEGDCYRCVLVGLVLPPGTTPAEALHTFMLDSGASCCFFRDSTTLTPLPAPVPVRLADPSGVPVVARSSTVLPCLAVPSSSLSGLHLPSFSTNLVSTAALQDAMVTTTTPGGQRVSICTCTRTGRHLATFTRRPGSSLYTLATEPPQVAASAQVSTSLPPLPPSPALPCLPCVEGRQRAAPHSSSFPLTTAPLQTLHMDVWGPARVCEQGRERYFLLVVDDYTWYTMVFPLRSKGEVLDVLIPWIRTVRLQLRERFGTDLPVLRLHSDRGVMEVARTSMIHAAAPHFLWPFAVRYAAHQLNLWPRVSSPTLRWTGKVGDASVFRVWGSHAFVRDTFADKFSARAIPCNVTFDESVRFYRLFPYRSAPTPPPPLFLAPGPPP